MFREVSLVLINLRQWLEQPRDRDTNVVPVERLEKNEKNFLHIKKPMDRGLHSACAKESGPTPFTFINIIIILYTLWVGVRNV